MEIKKIGFLSAAIVLAGIFSLSLFLAGCPGRDDPRPPALVPVESVTIDGPADYTLEVDQTLNLTATVHPDDADDATVTWASSDTAVATVNTAGLVTALTIGITNITATAGGVTSNPVEIEVIAAGTLIQVDNVTIDPVGPILLEVNDTETLTATVLPEDANNLTVVWTGFNVYVERVSYSQDGNVATVTIRAAAVGEANIRATAGGEHSEVAVTVRAAPLTGTLGDFIVFDDFDPAPSWAAQTITEGGTVSGSADPFHFGSWNNTASAEWVAHEGSLSLQVNGTGNNFGPQLRNVLEVGDTLTVRGRAFGGPAAPGSDRSMVIVPSGGREPHSNEAHFDQDTGAGGFSFTLTLDVVSEHVGTEGVEIRVYNNVGETPVTHFIVDSITVTREILWDYGDLVIFRGGPRPGLSIVPLEDYPIFHTVRTSYDTPGPWFEPWNDSVDLYADVTGNGLDGRDTAIRVGRSRDIGNGFGLALNTPFDMSDVVALSFWARTNNPAVTGVAFGFGEEGVFPFPPAYWWRGSHRGVLFRDNNNTSAIALTADWQQFIVPVPHGIDFPGGELSRVFTAIVRISDGAQATAGIYIDNIEFLTSGVTFAGMRVQDEIPGLLPIGVEINVAEMVTGQTAWEYILDSDDSRHRIFVESGYRVVPLYGWDLTGHNEFTVVEVTNVIGGVPGDIVISDDGKGIYTEVGSIQADLIFENAHGHRTNPVRVIFDVADPEYLVLAGFYGLSGGINAPANTALGYWHSGWWGVFETEDELREGRSTMSFMGQTGFAGVGRQGQVWNLSGFDYITFGVWANFGEADGGNSAEDERYRFFLETSGAVSDRFFVDNMDIVIDSSFNLSWAEIRIPVSGFPAGLDLSGVTGWRLHRETSVRDSSVIWLSDIRAVRVEVTNP